MHITQAMSTYSFICDPLFCILKKKPVISKTDKNIVKFPCISNSNYFYVTYRRDLQIMFPLVLNTVGPGDTLIIKGRITIYSVMRGGYLTTRATLEATTITDPGVQIGPWDGCNLKVEEDSYHATEYKQLMALADLIRSQIRLRRCLNRYDKSTIAAFHGFVSGAQADQQSPPFKHNIIDPSKRATSREHEQKERRQQRIQDNRHIRFND